MKLVGLLFVICASLLLGHRAAERRERRASQLAAMVFALHALETEVVFGRLLLADALERAGSAAPECRWLFEETAAGIKRGDSAARAWSTTLGRWRQRSALTEADVEPLRRLGGVLGLSHAQDQARHIGLAQREVERRLEEERGRLPQVARVYRALGLCGGIAACLLLY